MSVSGLAVEAVFGALKIIPSTRPTQLAPESVAFNYTSVLNVVALAGFAVLVALHRRAGGDGSAHARDPVCGMRVEAANAPARRQRDGGTVYFCSDGCADAFDRQHAAVAPAELPVGKGG